MDSPGDIAGTYAAYSRRSRSRPGSLDCEDFARDALVVVGRTWTPVGPASVSISGNVAAMKKTNSRAMAAD